MVALAVLRSGERSQAGLGLGFKSDMENVRSLKIEGERNVRLWRSRRMEAVSPILFDCNIWLLLANVEHRI
jgi:hypothetical protein